MKNMAPLGFFTAVVGWTLMIVLIPAVLILLLDPFFIYHKPWFVNVENPHSQHRMQNAGLINHWMVREGRADTIIVGTSMSENFPLDGHSLRLTFAGGRPREIRYVTEKAIATGKVKTVIWEVYWPYIQTETEDLHPNSPLPVYMYNQTVWDDWRYFFNADVAKSAIDSIRDPAKKRRPLEELYTWDRQKFAQEFKSYASADNIKSLDRSVRALDTLPITAQPPAPDQDYDFPNLAKNMLPIIRANPDIRFMLFFPPVSFYAYLKSGSEGIWREMKMREELLRQVAGMENVTVHGFDLMPGLGGDPGNYKDDHHYGPEINRMMLDHMQAGRHILTSQTFPAYRDRLLQNLNRYYRDILSRH